MPIIKYIRRKRSTLSQSAISASALVLMLISLLFAPVVQAVTQSQINDSARAINDIKVKLANTKTRLNTLRASLTAIDAQILDQRREVRGERTANRRQYHEALREFKRQTFEIDRIERDLALTDSDIELIEREMGRDRQRYENLNIIKKRLEEGEFSERQQGFKRNIERLKASKIPLNNEMEEARAKLETLRAQLDSDKQELDDESLDKDPRVATLLEKKRNLENSIKTSQNAIAALENRLEKDNLAFNRLMAQYKSERGGNLNLQAESSRNNTRNLTQQNLSDKSKANFGSYVFVISGKQEPNIESILKLKKLVENYDAKYIEAKWNGFDGNTEQNNNEAFKQAFREYIHQIPKQAKIILIGHGLGGGTAIDAATQVAYDENREIELLAVFDPVGKANLRANIVYNTNGNCFKPDPNNVAANTEYAACLRASKKRSITPNIKYFYNRWQKDAIGPDDSLRRILTLNPKGDKISVPTASGRFDTNSSTDSDQKRIFFNGDSSAHTLLLTSEAKNLPNLLVEHLR